MGQSDTVTLLFACDPWHSNGSRVLIGASKDRQGALRLLQRAIKESGHAKLTREDMTFFMEFGQTQGYTGDGEFDTQDVVLEEVECALCEGEIEE